MKNTYYLLLLVLYSFCFNSQIKAQVFFTEDFEGTPGTSSIPTGWTESGLSTDGIYTMGDATAASSTYWTVPAHTNFVYTNDDACNCDKSVDRLNLPPQDFTGKSNVNLTFDYQFIIYQGSAATVQVSTNGGINWTVVDSLPASATSTAWSDGYVVDLSAYANQSNISISFLYDDQGGWEYGLTLDNVSLSVPPSDDLSMQGHDGEYTLFPALQLSSIPLSATVGNPGTNNATDAILTANVFLNGNSTPVFTASSPASAVNSGATANLVAGSYTPSAVGNYQVQYTVSSVLLTDANSSNDTLNYFFNVDNNYFARDNGVPAGGIGTNPGAEAIIGQVFTMPNGSTKMDSVFFFIAPGAAAFGDTIQVIITDVVGGVPTNEIGYSANYIISAADTLPSGSVIQLAVTNTSGGPLTFAASTLFVGIRNSFTGANMSLQSSSAIYTPNTTFGNINGGAYVPVVSLISTFTRSFIIRPYISYACPAISSSSSSTDASCGATDGTATITPSGGTAPYTYAWDASAASQTTSTATGLAAGTYAVVYTDSFGCANTDSVTVSNANAPTLGITVANSLDCDDSANGVLNAIDSGGTGTITFQWGANANNQTAQSASGLTAGSYSVTATDAAGCTVTATYVLVAPDSIAVVPDNIANVSCFGGTDGAIEVTTLGGTPAYTYLWSNGATTEDLVGIPAGLYSGTITDANGCTFSAALPITEPTQLVASATDLGNGQSANANGTGGTPPYTFQWDAAANNQTAQTASNLTPGTYSVTVTDANGCSDDTTVTILATNINTIEGIGSLNMFPNPANAEVIVDIQLEQNMDVAILVMNVTGQTMIATQLGAIETQRAVLDIRQLTSGVYTVQINIGTEVISKKLIVSKQ